MHQRQPSSSNANPTEQPLVQTEGNNEQREIEKREPVSKKQESESGETVIRIEARIDTFASEELVNGRCSNAMYVIILGNISCCFAYRRSHSHAYRPSGLFQKIGRGRALIVVFQLRCDYLNYTEYQIIQKFTHQLSLLIPKYA
ncbi:Hypothetical_protein [Hexamita inflata]|uniref:Hypothetical_protein n=1 Tax=Hexamita inflata TaxID=28002 RepID=A0AA86U5V6_9EUKA|nr:Hypothetical protein HINF_LOCUS29804 [Hexamita inflata]